MEIFGVGGWELIAILLIMLVVAGPKRMLQWAYIVGRYVAKFRAMWAETMTMIQKEFDAAGVDVKLPKEPPTRQSIRKMTGEALKPFTAPIEAAKAEVDAELKSVKEAATITSTNGKPAPQDSVPKPPDEPGTQNFGTWSQAGKD
jgi:Sec-independent protein translocase protein TatA